MATEMGIATMVEVASIHRLQLWVDGQRVRDEALDLSLEDFPGRMERAYSSFLATLAEDGWTIVASNGRVIEHFSVAYVVQRTR